MKKTIVELPNINLIGISIIANNSDKVQNIGTTWGKYLSENISEKIDCKETSGVIYAVYTNYESDFHGDYTFFIGEEVKSLNDAKGDLSTLHIPTSNYIKFTNEGDESVIDIWKNIWQMERENSLGGERSYTADFEIYDSKNNGVVDIYIGIKNNV